MPSPRSAACLSLIFGADGQASLPVQPTLARAGFAYFSANHPLPPPSKNLGDLVQLDISFSKSALNPEQKCPNIASTVFGQCLATNIVLVWPSQRPNRRLNILDGWKVGQSFLSMFLHQASSSLCLPPL